MGAERNDLADLAETIGNALIEFARRTRAEAEVASEYDLALPAQLEEVRENLGPRQRAIFDLPGVAVNEGMKTSEIAERIDYSAPNTNQTLANMERQGLVEQVPGSAPRRWRRAPQFRNEASEYVQIAELVPAGRFTTYGDISLVLTGSIHSAQAVGTAMMRADGFAGGHRVLRAGGAIPPTWSDGAGGGPEVAVRRLEAEGVEVKNMKADPARYLPWQQLRERAQRAGLVGPLPDEDPA